MPSSSKAKAVGHLGKIGDARLDLLPKLDDCSPGLRPVEYNVIVAPVPATENAKIGSIYLPDESKETLDLAMQVGRIVAQSPLAYDYAQWGDDSLKPQIGDAVWFARYAGKEFEGADGKPDGVTPGILPNLSSAFNNSMWSPDMQGATAAHTGVLQNDQGIDATVHNTGLDLLNGKYDPHITAAGPIAGAAPINPQAPTPTGARASQGALDPTNTLKGFLDGSNTNPWIEQQQALTDSATRNLMENVMPGIRSGANMSGMYGSDREGIAQGQAVSRMNTDLAPALAQLASGAYESGQNRSLATASGLNDQAGSFAQNNANRALSADTTNAGLQQQTQQFNTGTQLQNNAQGMQASGMDTANRLAGTNVAGASAGLEDQRYQDLINSLQAPGNAGWQNLAKYASIFQPMMGMYPSTTTNASGTGSSQMTGTQVVPQQQSNPLGIGLGALLSAGSLAGGLGWKPFG